MTEEPEEVTPEMVEALAARFQGAAPPPLPPAPARKRRRREPHHYLDTGKEIVFEGVLPGFAGSRSVVGTDGSCSSFGGPIAAFAAIRGDGAATYGWYIEPTGHTDSCTAELQAIRFGLRNQPNGAYVSLRLDNVTIIDAIRYMNIHPGHYYRYRGGRRYYWGCNDTDALREVSKHVYRLNVQVRYVGDPEGDTNAKRCPADPTMRAAHRLAWATRRLVSFGLPLTDPRVNRWLTHRFAVGDGRYNFGLRNEFDRFVAAYG